MKFLKTYRHLSIEDTNLLKGISILLIGFHNFYRNIPPHFGENEFYFNSNFLTDWIAYISQKPFEIFIAIFSFLGHYGVSAFVLISGYGLAMGFKNKEIPLFTYFASRVKKIYPTFFLGVVLAIVIALAIHRYPTQHELWESVFWKLSLLSPFRADMMYALYGPWWFFGLIFHLYALFPLLLFLLKRNHLVLFWGLLSILFVLPHTNLIQTSANYYASALYQLPLFGLGVFLGYQKELYLPKHVVYLALFLLLYGQGNFVIWKFTHVSAAILIVLLVLYVREKQWKFNKIMIACGILSFHFFVIHPVIRAPFLLFAEYVNSIYFTTFFGLVYIAIAYLAAILFRKIDNKFRELLTNMGKMLNKS